MPRARRTKSKGSKWSATRLDTTTVRTFESFEDAERAEREYWWSRTPAQRLRELERLRQINYGYGQGRPLPRFQRILRVVSLEELDREKAAKEKQRR